jgi:hypothetical protein
MWMLATPMAQAGKPSPIVPRLSVNKKTEDEPKKWVDLSRERRAAIVQTWQKLPESTRPPFPIYRDSVTDPDKK